MTSDKKEMTICFNCKYWEVEAQKKEVKNEKERWGFCYVNPEVNNRQAAMKGCRFFVIKEK